MGHKATEINTNVWTKCRGNQFNDVSGCAEVAHQLICHRSQWGFRFPCRHLLLCEFLVGVKMNK